MDTIRLATAADAEAICHVHQRAIRLSCGEAYSPAVVIPWAEARRPAMYLQTMRDETMFVAVRAGSVVGFCCVLGNELRGLYVDPETGRGTGSALLQRAEAVALAGQPAEVRVTATLNAVRFYERQGYQRLHPATVRRPHRAPLAVWEMAKPAAA
jgi:putative acetyltransferase